MSDFLGRLAARAQGEALVVRPRVRSLYEPGQAGLPPEEEVWGEEVVEVAARKEARDGRDSRDDRDRREERKVEAGEAPFLEARVERPRRVAPPSPTVRAVEPPRLPRPAPADEERAMEAAARPVPAPAPVEARPRPAKAVRQAARETVAAPREVPAPAAPMPAARPAAPGPRRSEPRVSSPPEPGPRLERRVEAPEPAAPALPETRPAVRTSRPAEPLPTVGPRRGVPDLAPVPGAAGEPPGTEEVVQVSIGRIDVHAGPPTTPAPAPRRPAGPRLSLADYLKARSERRR